MARNLQLKKFHEFNVQPVQPPGMVEEEDRNDVRTHIPLLSLATRDTAPDDVANDPTADDFGHKQVIMYVKQRLAEHNRGLYDALKKQHSKTLAELYKTYISTKKKSQKFYQSLKKPTAAITLCCLHRQNYGYSEHPGA